MATRIVVANGVYDLSNVTNLKELEEEIAFLKDSIKNDEKALGKQFRLFPQHAVKSAADSILPSFLNKIIANGSWKLLLSGLSMFANPFSKKFSFKKNILGSAKRLGLMALIKTGFSYWKNSKSSKSKITTGLKRTNGVTMLKPAPVSKK